MVHEMDETDRQGIIQGRHATEKREAAHTMRRQMTPAEALLWERLRASRLGGLHFRRQQIIDGFIVDFYCHAASLVIECDGPVHEQQREHDLERDIILGQRGLLTLRFTNDQIETSMNAVLQHIFRTAQERIQC
jgi:very-short-patch-repair endonuclease